MSGAKALLFAPVQIVSGATYRIHAELKRESGNGLMCCNLFANRNFDFPQVAFTCDSGGWALYDITLRAGDLPPNMPVVLRFWRPRGGTGTMLVRSIGIEQITEPGKDEPEAQALTVVSPEPTAATKAHPRQGRPGGQPAAPNPEAAKRVRVSKELEQQRAQQRRARRRKLGAPSARPRQQRARRNRRTASHFDRASMRVMLVMGDDTQQALREKAFAQVGFSTQVFVVGQGRSLADRLKEFKPSWIHVVMDGTNPPGDQAISAIQAASPGAVVSAWLPSADFDCLAVSMLKHADLALVGGFRAQAAYKGSGIPASQWHEGNSDAERADAIRNLGRRLGFMEVLAHDFKKDRIRGSFKRLLCFVASGTPELFACQPSADDGMAMKFLPFVDCDDFEEQAMRYRPDWIHIHIHCGADLPWKQALLDMRRKLPRALVTAWHAGSQPPSPGFIALADSVDHMLVGSEDALPAHIADGMTHAEHWLPSALPAGPDFARDMEGLARKLRAHRRSFLLDPEGSMVDLSVFIGTCNRLDKLRTAVACVFASSGQRRVEVIVNDAGSTDGTIEWLRKKAAEDPRVRLILSGKRTSFTQAFNESLRIAKGKYVCWLSDDIMARNTTMSDMCSLMDTLGPLDMGAFPIWNSWAKRVSYTLRKSRGFLCPTVGCMHTETMRRLNGINIDYPYYGQDTELDYRVLRLGGSIVECQAAQLDHMCDLDELRSSNIKQHETMRGSDKFEIVSQKLERDRHQYPAILLLLKDRASMDRAEQAAAAIRRHYSRSHIYVASEPRTAAIGVMSTRRAPVPAPGAGKIKFDLVIHLHPDQHQLVVPGGKNGLPFVRSLIP